MDVLNLNLLSVIPLGVALLAPGSILLSLEAKVASCRKLGSFDRTTRYLAYSLVVYMILDSIWGHVIERLTVIGFTDAIWIGTMIACSTVFAIPVPVVVGIVRRTDLFGRALRRCKIPAFDPISTAWEKAFDRRDGCLVSISCKDGIERFGIYGPGSLVSDDINDGDLFFEEAYCRNSVGQLVPEPGTLGLWIHRSEVKLLRFHNMMELVQNGEEQQIAIESQQNNSIGDSTKTTERFAKQARPRIPALKSGSKTEQADLGSEGSSEVTVRENGRHSLNKLSV